MAIFINGKNQYLGRIEDLISLDVYNAGIYNDGIYNFPIGVNIGNNWTIGFWVKPRASKEFQAIFTLGARTKPNHVFISTTPIPEQDAKSELRVIITDQNAQIIKHYSWGDWFSNNRWEHTTIQWDGSELNAFRNSFPTTTGVLFTNSSGILGDFPARAIFYGTNAEGFSATFSGTLGHMAIWDSILDIAELQTIVSGGFQIDLTTTSGSYTSQDNLVQYWKPGEDLTNVGKSFATITGTHDLDKIQGISVNNITIDSP